MHYLVYKFAKNLFIYVFQFDPILTTLALMSVKKTGITIKWQKAHIITKTILEIKPS